MALLLVNALTNRPGIPSFSQLTVLSTGKQQKTLVHAGYIESAAYLDIYLGSSRTVAAGDFAGQAILGRRRVVERPTSDAEAGHPSR